MMKLRTPTAMAAGRSLALLMLITVAPACVSRETTASRSAAAYDEAVLKGTAVKGGEAHGQHGQAPGKKEPGEAAPAMDHSQMEGMGGAKAPDASPGSMKGMDHSGMAAKPGAPMKMKGMDHSTMGASGKADEMAGMDHAAMGHGTGAAKAPSKPEPAAAVAVAGQPGTTLRPDAYDEAAPTSIGDAARASAMAAEMAGGGHPMQHGAYAQTDAGRESATPSSPTQPAPAADPHQMRATPTPRPAPAPQTGHQAHGPAASPKPSPTPDPHRLHRATPSPTPVPHKHEDHR